MIRSCNVAVLGLIAALFLRTPLPAQDEPGAAKKATKTKSAKATSTKRATTAPARGASRTPAALPQTDPRPSPTAPAAKAEAPSRFERLFGSEVSDLERTIGAPATTEDLWRALGRDLEYGLRDDAKRHLQALLERPDLNDKIVELREKYGSAMLIRLQSDPELAALSRDLVQRANEASRKKARDPERIRYFLGQLSKSAGERDYAIIQLRHAGAFALPYFIDALKANRADRVALLEGLFALHSSCWPAAVAVLDSNDPELMGIFIDLLRHFGERKAVDYLWYLAGSNQFPQAMRSHAALALSDLTGIPAGDLPSSVAMLTRAAERYYNHESGLGLPNSTVEVWRWQGNQLVHSVETVTAVEEYLGTKFASQALAIDPSYEPARVLLLSLALEKSYEKVGVDKNLPAAKQGILETTLAVGPQLMTQVLTKAIEEKRTAVVLGAVQVLGNTGRASLLTGSLDKPAPLLQALNYPNARVQFAAALATLEIHPTGYMEQSSRVVDTLVRALSGEHRPQALVLDSDDARGRETATLLQEIGYKATLHVSGRSGFQAAAESAGVDLVFIEPTIRNWELDATVANFRADARTAGLPLVIFNRDDIRERIDSLARRYPRILSIPRLADQANMQKALELGFADPLAKPLTPAEKLASQRAALDWIVRLARGELPFFDVKPAVDALTMMLDSPEFGAQAAEALGYLPSTEVQEKLAATVLAETQSMPNRLAACKALARNIQLAGTGIPPGTANRLVGLFEKVENRDLRAALARLTGSMGPADGLVSRRIREYRPLTKADLEPPAPEKPASDKPDLEPKPAEPKPAEKQERRKRSFFDTTE